MTVALATTWYPRGELDRLLRLIPRLREWYRHRVIVLPPDQDVKLLQALGDSGAFNIRVAADWADGRYLALSAAVETGADYIHYADLDRLIRWAETREGELIRTLERLQTVDCLMIGRTAQAFATHPRALRATETVINSIFSRLLGQPLDLTSGSKGLSRQAARFLIANTRPGHGLGGDAEWPVLLCRAGFTLTRFDVDGLDWETADRYLDGPADERLQREAAGVYDAIAENWAHRVSVAQGIIDAGIDAWLRPLQAVSEEKPE